MIFNYIITFIIFFVLDVSWIFLNYEYYSKLCRRIQKQKLELKIIASIIAYICLSIGLYLYLKNINTYLDALFYGFLYGLAIYGTYAFTCCAYYTNYNYIDGITETSWGITLFIISGVFYKLISTYI